MKKTAGASAMSPMRASASNASFEPAGIIHQYGVAPSIIIEMQYPYSPPPRHQRSTAIAYDPPAAVAVSPMRWGRGFSMGPPQKAGRESAREEKMGQERKGKSVPRP